LAPSAGVHHLHGIDVAELAGADAVADGFERAVPHGLKGFFREDAHGMGLAGAKPDHLLLHQGLKTMAGKDAIEMLESKAEDALAGAAVEAEHGKGVIGNFAGYFFEGSGVQSFLIAEVVIEEGLVLPVRRRQWRWFEHRRGHVR
jgi:hypothetical protein